MSAEENFKSLVDGFILVGGKSRRMGTDKAHLRLKGQTFLERISGELSAVTDRVTIVGGMDDEIKSQNPDGREIVFRHVPDVYSDWGALGGVHAALSTCKSEWALVVACDFPFVSRDLFARIIELRQDADAVAPIQSDLIPQPLCSLYRITPCMKLAEDLIKSSERKPIALLQSVRTRWVQFNEIADLEGANHFFDNINSPEDYDRIIKVS